MTYIIHDRFKGEALCGPVNLKATSLCWMVDGIIYYEGRPLCYTTSENAYEHIARDDDGCGMQRGQLTTAIKRRLAKRDDRYQERWDRVWADPMCQRFRR